MNVLQAIFGKSKDQIAEEEAANEPLDPERAAKKLMDILSRRQAHDSRHRKKPPSK